MYHDTRSHNHTGQVGGVFKTLLSTITKIEGPPARDESARIQGKG